MSSIIYEEIWNLLDTYQFDIDVLSHSDLVCLICSKIIKNACQTICGCRFCLQCLEQYLGSEEKCCPRQLDDCREQIINFQRDVTIDNATNRKISKIKVKCPESFCQCTVELSKMHCHMKSHQIKCPYSDIGCSQPKIDENKLIDHLNSENAFHTTLLLNLIQNLKNEIDILSENDNRKDKSIENLKTENLQLKHEIELLKTEDFELNRTEIFLVNQKLEENESLVNKLLDKIVDIENERLKLNDKINKIENIKKKSIFENNVNIDSEDGCEFTSELSLNETDNLDDRFGGFHVSSIIFNPKINKTKNTKKKSIFENNVNIDSEDGCEVTSELSPNETDNLDDLFGGFHVSPTKFAPFDWIIDDFPEKQYYAIASSIPQTFFSESFYTHTNGYKLRLAFYPNGDGEDWDKYLTVKFGIIVGEFDDRLSWPMRLTVTLALINQHTGEINICQSFNYNQIQVKNIFKKPVPYDDNDLYLYGTNKLININSLKNNRKLLRNQSIHIKCIIE